MTEIRRRIAVLLLCAIVAGGIAVATAGSQTLFEEKEEVLWGYVQAAEPMLPIRA